MTSTTDYLAFWSKAIPNLHVHPDDEAALKSNPHEFALDTLVGPWMGPIRTAPVVILMLNGGMAGNGEEARAAQMPTARESMAHNLTGDAPLPNWEGIGNPAGREWTTRRLNQFGVSYKAASDKVAVVNLIPYRSKEGAKDIRMADRLESCRVLRSWMHYTIFKEAEAGKRVVICMRSHRHWGLERGTNRGVSLFSPVCNRAGFTLHDERAPIGQAVRRAVFKTAA